MEDTRIINLFDDDTNFLVLTKLKVIIGKKGGERYAIIL